MYFIVLYYLIVNDIMFHFRSNTIESEGITIVGAMDRFPGSISPFYDVVYISYQASVYKGLMVIYLKKSAPQPFWLHLIDASAL